MKYYNLAFNLICNLLTIPLMKLIMILNVIILKLFTNNCRYYSINLQSDIARPGDSNLWKVLASMKQQASNNCPWIVVEEGLRY
jgi:hypothetical protein